MTFYQHDADWIMLLFSDETVVQWEGNVDGEQQVFGRVQLNPGAHAPAKTTGLYNSETKEVVNSKQICV